MRFQRARWVSTIIQVWITSRHAAALYTGPTRPSDAAARARSAPIACREAPKRPKASCAKMPSRCADLEQQWVCRPRRHAPQVGNRLAPATYQQFVLIAMFAEFDLAQATYPRPLAIRMRHVRYRVDQRQTPPAAARQTPRPFFHGRSSRRHSQTPSRWTAATVVIMATSGCRNWRQRRRFLQGGSSRSRSTAVNSVSAGIPRERQRHAPVVVL